MSKLRDFIDAPRKHPVRVLLTHIPLLAFWIALAVHDFADGSIQKKRGPPATEADDPIRFYIVAAAIVFVAVLIVVRIVRASLALSHRRSR